MKTTKKRLIALFLAVALLLAAALVLWIAVWNSAVGLTQIRVESVDVPKGFRGFRIVHVSDLHNAEMGKDNERLLSLIKEAEPDIIVVTGDIIDSRRTDADVAVDFMKGAVLIAPCYYVTGNHESRMKKTLADLETAFSDMGVVVLRNESVVLEREGDSVTVIGVDDPLFGGDLQGTIAGLSDDGSYSILLSHRPELFSVYVEQNIDLVFSGHAHGGQVRLPFIGGVIAPHQGFFPEYTEGAYTEGGTTMIVSRGIGNSMFPFRVNNRPEVVLAELWDDEQN